jgi:hypothetical protein
MRAMAEHAQARGEIANRFYSGRLTLPQTFEALNVQETRFVQTMKRLREATTPGGSRAMTIAPGVTLEPMQ